jgi:hypothetical protein
VARRLADLPVFGSSVTYSDLGSGPHTLRIEHGGGTVYVDGFEICGPEGEVEVLARFAASNKSASGALEISVARTHEVR